MQMRRKAMMGASAILLGACMLMVGLLNLRFPSYGGDFLRIMSSVYPGFHDSRTIGQVMLGTIYGVLDGAILGYIFSSLYRWVGGLNTPDTKRTSPAAIDPLMRRAS
jgi:hypothetical protein